jgi:hypothetical protein
VQLNWLRHFTLLPPLANSRVELRPGAPEKSPGLNPENFAKVKAATLKNHQARILILQQTASCVQSAGDFSPLRVCHQKEREAHKDIRDQIQGEMEAMRAQRRQGRPEKPGPR